MTEKPTAEAPAPAQNDPTLAMRRVMVWVVALILALVTAALILQVGVVILWPNNGGIPLDATIPISFVNIPLVPIMALPLTLFWMIWIDFFFRTRIVND